VKAALEGRDRLERNPLVRSREIDEAYVFMKTYVISRGFFGA